MTRDIEILKSLYLPEIEEIYPFAPGLKTSIQQDAFWDYFNTILFDAKEIANFLYSYKVAKAEHFISRFEQLKKEYISYLASDYCNGEMNPTIELFLKIQFKPFIEEVTFQKEIKQAITITEHERLKKKLSLIDDAAAFEITDTEITSAFQLLEKKNEHEKLKEKMKEWDRIGEPVYSNKSPQHTFLKKIILIICLIGILVGLTIIFWPNQHKQSIKPKDYIPSRSEKDSVLKKNDSLQLNKLPKSIVVEQIDRNEFYCPVFSEAGLDTKMYTVVDNLEPRINSLRNYIKNCQEVEHSDCNKAKKELGELLKMNRKYIFNERVLYIFYPFKQRPLLIKTTDRNYYLRLKSNYFQLTQNSEPNTMNKLTDSLLIEKLNLIVYKHSFNDKH